MNKIVTKSPVVNLKETTATHKFRITIRDREHFYKLIKWLNENVGKGEDKWTMEGRILKSLNTGKTISPNIYIFIDDFDVSCASYLSLM